VNLLAPLKGRPGVRTEKENFSFFGRTRNSEDVCERGQCAATAAINSFIFLENQHELRFPSLTPGRETPQSRTDVEDRNTLHNILVKLGGFAGDIDKPGGVEKFVAAYMSAKNEYFTTVAKDAPPMEILSKDGDFLLQNVTWLGDQIKNKENVELAILNWERAPDGTTQGHVITLTGIRCQGTSENPRCSILYQDPNHPNDNVAPTR
jgi:hypothetical protein